MEKTVKIPAREAVMAIGVIKRVEPHGSISRIFVEVPQISAKCRPGHFVHVKTPAADQLLRVPISVAFADGKIMELMVKNVGAGTCALVNLPEGSSLDLLGPLGTPFPALSNEAVLVGGGVGIAPMLYLSHSLKERGIKHTLYWGARNAGEIYLMDRKETRYATEDGSYGEKGLVTALLDGKLKKDQIVCTCGPTPMMKAVAKLARAAGCTCYASLEEWMGCGIGACLGCAVETVRGIERVCSEGPVFNAEDLIEYR